MFHFRLFGLYGGVLRYDVFHVYSSGGAVLVVLVFLGTLLVNFSILFHGFKERASSYIPVHRGDVSTYRTRVSNRDQRLYLCDFPTSLGCRFVASTG